MENITHSLVGATLAELVLPAGSSTARRRVFFLAGIAAANLPDADLLYTRITPPPLGYLLHHRGHTHTIAGLVAQGLLIGVVCLLPVIARQLGDARGRLWALLALALSSHLVLDSWNSYGVHPFWPIESRWFYGDAIFIAEPWLWLLLGTAATLNTRTDRGRLLLGTALALLPIAATSFGQMPVAALAAIVAAAVGLGWLMRERSPRWRSSAALALTAAFVASMFGLRHRVHDRVVASMTSAERAGVLDVVLNPRPANPLCWNALAIVRDEGAGEYRLTRGSATSLGGSGCGEGRLADVVWDEPVRQPLQRLRALHANDCAVRAWLQFGRAPVLDERAIGDLRFGGTSADNFSMMPLSPAGPSTDCPPNLTTWTPPRADLLSAAR